MIVSQSGPLHRVTTANITGSNTPHYTVDYLLTDDGVADEDSGRAQDSYSRSSSFITLKSYRSCRLKYNGNTGNLRTVV